METRAPNVLLVIVDDMGAHHLGCYGSTYFETPCIDGFARTGVRFGTAYSASPVCSPSRAALYTGQHPARLHLTNFIPGTEPANARLVTPPWRAHLPVETFTIGDAFKARGYATGHFGKWHLSPDYHYRPGRPMDPESQGFDTVCVTRKPLIDADPEKDPHHIDRLTDEAIRFMSAPRQQPFFCVLAHNALHRPELAPAAAVARFAARPGADAKVNRPVLAAMTEHVDRSFGRLLAHLVATGLDRETLVIFTADHGSFGPSEHRKPLRGAKADIYDGGIRVPLVARWPGRLGQGVVAAPVFGTDLLPTLLDLVGGSPPPVAMDGVSLRAQLEEPSAPLAPRSFFWHFPHYHHLGLAPAGAIRSGRWKLIEWFERTIGGARDGAPYELFDLEADPGESVNRAAEQPDLCARLARELAAWRRDVGAQEMTRNPAFDDGGSGPTVPPPPGDLANPFGE